MSTTINFTQGSARDVLSPAQVEQLTPGGTIARDDRRRRPLYFDGRFLDADALTRDQNYFLTRQADLGRAGGSGVVHGLQVIRGTTDNQLIIQPGHGVSSAGELIVLQQPLRIDVADATEIQKLNVRAGLSGEPTTPSRNLSGIFIVGVRPVEFTANPLAAYPTTLTGTRTTNDGDIIEATAAALIPYNDGRSAQELSRSRSLVAHEIFNDQARLPLPVSVLPLAMVGLQRGIVAWIDLHLVRREVGAEHGDILGLGFAPRALREAHLLQYEAQLANILREKHELGQSLRFAATDRFLSLPPAGRLPAAAINPGDFSQVFFPPGIDVQLSIIPEDEIAALVEESLLLPAIDLTMNEEMLESTAVLVVIPVSRSEVRRVASVLQQQTQSAAFVRPLLSPAPQLMARLKPIDVLRGLRPIPFPFRPLPEAENVIEAEWRGLLARHETLWYVRRRNIAYSAEVVGVGRRVFRDEADEEAALRQRLNQLGLNQAFDRLLERGTLGVGAELASALIPKLGSSSILIHGAVRELQLEGAAAGNRITQPMTLRVMNRFERPGAGEGILKLEGQDTFIAAFETFKVRDKLARTQLVPEIDRLTSKFEGTKLDDFRAELIEVATPDTADVKDVKRIVILAILIDAYPLLDEVEIGNTLREAEEEILLALFDLHQNDPNYLAKNITDLAEAARTNDPVVLTTFVKELIQNR